MNSPIITIFVYCSKNPLSAPLYKAEVHFHSIRATQGTQSGTIHQLADKLKEFLNTYGSKNEAKVTGVQIKHGSTKKNKQATEEELDQLKLELKDYQ